MSQLLIVANAPSPNTLRLRDAIHAGAAATGLPTLTLSPEHAGVEQVLQARAIILGTTENFGYMSGLLKDFFERIYYPCLEQTQGLSVALYVKAGNDGQGAVRSVERVITGLRWNLVQPPLIFKGEYQPDFADDCHELGESIAEGLKLGIF